MTYTTLNGESLVNSTSVEKQQFPTWPFFAPDEIAAAAEVLRSGRANYWTGEEGRKFETEFAEFCGTQYAIALANGTVALELALYALGIGPGDEVITTSRTFIASASCAIMRGAIPVFADVDRVSQTITADTIRNAITERTRAIIPVHLAGWPCDMDPILQLARERNLYVIEDCAQAHGATYKGRPVGSFGHVSAFSFCQDKIMTSAGEGGMLVTNDEELWKRGWAFKDHGKSWDAVYKKEHRPGFRWLHESFGTNWRLTEVQSAIGRKQLAKVPGWIATRRQYARTLDQHFSRLDALRVTIPPSSIGHAYYKYYAFVQPERLRSGWTRDRIIAAINAEGVPCFQGSCSEIYLEKAFSELYDRPSLKNARELGETSLMFLVHPTLTDSNIADTVAATEKVLKQATR